MAAMVAAACPRCDSVVSLLEGYPVVAGDSVELWHRACWAVRDVPLPVKVGAVVASSPPSRTRLRRPTLTRPAKVLLGGIALSSLVAIGMAQWTWMEMRPPVATSFASFNVDPIEPTSVRAALALREDRPKRMVWVPTESELKYAVPTTQGVPLDEQYSSLRGWTHPVTHSAEHMPTQASRLFGVGRLGVEIPRAECGEGHCGVDLDGPVGRALVAVADGNVVNVERREMGGDSRSGRYVRIEHDDGTLTAYMHMDQVAPNLQPRDHVRAGEYIGTLGATATYGAPAHLHFSVEIPTGPGRHYDSARTRFVNPAPFLARSTIIAEPAFNNPIVADQADDAAEPPRARHAKRPIKPAF